MSGIGFDPSHLQEEFISDLAQAGRESELSKQRFEEKIERLEQDAAQTRADLAAAQIRLKDLEEKSRRRKGASQDVHLSEEGEGSDGGESHGERISRHHREIARYENRLKDMAKLLDLTGRSPRKYLRKLTRKKGGNVKSNTILLIQGLKNWRGVCPS